MILDVEKKDIVTTVRLPKSFQQFAAKDKSDIECPPWKFDSYVADALDIPLETLKVDDLFLSVNNYTKLHKQLTTWVTMRYPYLNPMSDKFEQILVIADLQLMPNASESRFVNDRNVYIRRDKNE